MMSWPSARDWVFSFKAFIAAMLALYIAMYLGLPRPYWAMGSVYIVAHPLTGATRSKALYRVLGTLLGAAASIAMVPPLVNSPPLLMGAVAIWVACLLYVALMHRTPRSYLFMLAAYTLPLIALPSVDNPVGVFDLAVARSEEICLGILCAAVVGAVVLPTSVANVLRDKSRQWMADATLWASDMLSPAPGASVSRHHSRHRLAADILALDQLISQLSYDAESATRVRAARELRGRMTMLLPVMASLATIVESLQAAGGLPAPLAAQMQAVKDWIQGGAAADARPVLAATPVQAGWDAALVTAAEDRLQQMLALWHDCVTLCRRLGEKHIEGPWVPEFLRWDVGRARHYDHGMLLFSVVTVAMAIYAMGMVWIHTGWADGAGAVALGAISCCFFAALDEPAPMIRSFFNWNVVCLLISLVMLFAVLPVAHDFEMLVLMFAVPYLIIGLLVAQPRLAMIGMPLAVVTANDIGIQGAYSANFQSFFNSNVAGIAGIAFALVWTLVVRPFGTRAATRRLVRAGWSDIADNALGKHPDSHTVLRARMLDRLAQLVPRLAASDSEVSTDGFSEVRVELTALALQREMAGMPADEQHAVRRVLRSISTYYKARLDGSADAPPAALRTRLANAQDKVRSRVALAALVDMQVALFPPALPAIVSGKA
ncbi:MULTISPECIES: FUSC family protein [unclassified Cupriavidus]|uniref:FUSC family protein n=1 Tax=unclassified Cupriavidus TaxID=2640874 RepID=UPI001C006AE5|nr:MULTISPECIES: FUSC family protein [unclassified Cupriavidus]MCA3191626.1 FUSC family protein [Cupriavidus sp.]MCA3199779.1 FUSC family protein [Cupriavidus sp.]MCA3205485.1 FUSC family protein [Cupriavidus sp.]MCA3206107.1 FUSC family protein [Cupriavidus sp.]QWE96749.1 FUSC family protein [Cupriavidus sp. EM10]